MQLWHEALRSRPFCRLCGTFTASGTVKRSVPDCRIFVSSTLREFPNEFQEDWLAAAVASGDFRLRQRTADLQRIERGVSAASATSSGATGSAASGAGAVRPGAAADRAGTLCAGGRFRF